MPRTNFRCLVLIGFVSALVACASGPPPGPTPAQLAGMQAKTVVVAPFNIVSSLPPELEDSTKIVMKAMTETLQAHGKTVRTLSVRSGRDLWRASMKEVRDSGAKRNFENAARVYAKKIREHVDFDVLIVPSLFIQNAKSRSGWAYWDNAKQKVEVTGSSYTKDDGNVYLSDNFRAVSIFLYVLDADGSELQSSKTGLELIQHVHFIRTREYNVVNDAKMIDDADRVRAGIRMGLAPFLPEAIPLAPPANLDPPPANPTTSKPKQGTATK